MGREETTAAAEFELAPERIEAESEPRIEPEPEFPDFRLRTAPWVKPLSCYERRETTVVEGLRYG
jgi:hypothetical protein